MHLPVSAEAARTLAAHSGLTTSTALGLGGGHLVGKDRTVVTVQGLGGAVRLPSVLRVRLALRPSAPAPARSRSPPLLSQPPLSSEVGRRRLAHPPLVCPLCLTVGTLVLFEWQRIPTQGWIVIHPHQPCESDWSRYGMWPNPGH